MKTNFKLNYDQENALKFLREMIGQPTVRLLKGAAGTGKSTVVNRFIEEIEAQGINPTTCALSAKAALNVRGSTLARIFSLTNEKIFPFTLQSYLDGTRCNVDLDANLKGRIKKIQFLIIDEISMVRCDMLDCINLLMKQAKENSLQFGGVPVLLVGDFNQLPAFCAPSKTKDANEQPINILKNNWPKAFLNNSKDLSIRSCEHVELKQIKVFELKKLCRQEENDRLSYFLKDIIKTGKLAERHKKLLMKKKISNKDIYSCKDVTLLAAKNEAVKYHNRMYLEMISGDCLELVNVHKTSADKKRLSEFNLPKKMLLKRGSKIVFCLNDPESKNIEGSRFLNGQTATFLDYDNDKQKAFLEMHNETKTRLWVHREKHFKNDVIYDAFFDIPTTQYRGECKAFPFIPGFAMTVHKAQGMTIEKLCIDFNGMKDIKMIYTALSRAKSWENLYLTENSYIK